MLLFSAALAATPSQASALGPNVHVFTPDDDMKKVAETVETVFKRQHHRQFGPERQAFLFLPGDYTKADTLNVGRCFDETVEDTLRHRTIKMVDDIEDVVESIAAMNDERHT